MKKSMLFWVLVLSIGFLSCEKDDICPKPTFIFGEKMDKDLTVFAENLVYELKLGYTNDTIWALDPWGNPILDNNTGLPVYNQIVQVPITFQSQATRLMWKTKELHMAARHETIQHFNQNITQKTVVGFPEKTNIIGKITETQGESYQDRIIQLNDLCSLVTDEQNMTINQKIESLFENAEPILQTAAKEYFSKFACDFLGGCP